jgi:ornithine cyclodeaminase/alanine dehydrogenase-like protein (mu-crystallin family)
MILPVTVIGAGAFALKQLRAMAAIDEIEVRWVAGPGLDRAAELARPRSSV